MANKYVADGNTYDGDGTSSSPATSNGGVGAWNNLQNILTGTINYGSLNAGDVVYVKTKNASGNNITISFSAATTIGNSNATSDSPITWIFDTGDVWNGVSGTVTLEHGDNTLTITDANNFIASDYNLVLYTNVTSRGSSVITNIGKFCTLYQVLIDNSNVTSGYGGYLNCVGNGNSYLIGCKLKFSYYYQQLFKAGQYATIFLIGCIVELTESGETDSVFRTGNYASTLYLIGGNCYGDGAKEDVDIVYLTGTGGNVYMHGFTYPRVMSEYANYYKKLMGTGIDGKLGAVFVTQWYRIDSREDGYYPTLNAVLPTSDNKSWSYKVYNFGCNVLKPSRITTMKLYNQDAATKTITMEWLSNNEMPTPNTYNSYMVVSYVQNSDSSVKTISTFDVSATTISESSADWSAKTYGASAFTARKFEITTPTAIKKDTHIIITGFWGLKAENSSQIFFVDPDPVIS